MRPRHPENAACNPLLMAPRRIVFVPDALNAKPEGRTLDMSPKVEEISAPQNQPLRAKCTTVLVRLGHEAVFEMILDLFTREKVIATDDSGDMGRPLKKAPINAHTAPRKGNQRARPSFFSLLEFAVWQLE